MRSNPGLKIAFFVDFLLYFQTKKKVASIVGVVTRLYAELPSKRGSIPGKEKGLFFSKTSSPVGCPPNPPLY